VSFGLNLIIVRKNFLSNFWGTTPSGPIIIGPPPPIMGGIICSYIKKLFLLPVRGGPPASRRGGVVEPILANHLFSTRYGKNTL